ncbi:family 10 glycosylhydrolase [Niabella sp.]|uniref:glycoside hydrolase family 10 protein n=1 Tax=Niabella sp. TaxID=1962976 RepID=UPI0026334D63|nr:family 10 glycosylhydrolase [Niabella sp.]
MKKISWLFIIAAFILGFNACKKDNDNVDIEPQADVFTIPKKEMRAVWVTTAWGLDWPQDQYNMATQKQQYIDYLNRFKQLNMNAVFVQIKGMGDAFYNSPYEPWSAAITGTRGKDPGYDVLKFMLDEAHARGMEFHAWLNPYRIATRASSTAAYPALHPSIQPDWVVSHEKIQIYNPAVPEVRQRLADIVKDIITKYDVDGIHFDDYFYPDPSTAGTMVSDNADYAKYGAGMASIENFRRDNVNKAIKAVHDIIVATRPEVVFSISPAASDTYNYNTLYADVLKWNQEGWLDVIIPQLYQQIGAASNDFKERLQWWHQFRYKAAMMVGYGYYRFGDPTAPAAFQSVNELEKQWALTKKYKASVGHLLYSAKYVMQNPIGITDKLATLWTTPTVIPFLGRSVAPDPAEPQNVRIEGNSLKWEAGGNVRSVVYYTPDLKQEAKVLALTNDHTTDATSAGYYCVTTINSDNKESKASKVIQK